jgi:RND family efflux transporter MFP subunit
VSQNTPPSRLLTAVLLVVTLVVGLGLGAGALCLYATGGGQGPPGPGAGPAAAGAQGGNGPPPASVLVEPARRMELQQRFEVTGRLREVKRATIAAEVEGMLLDLPVTEGTRLIADQTVLARVEDVFVKLELQAAEAQVAEARADLEQLESDLRYLESLAQSNAARPKEVDDARAAVAGAQARLDASVARRDRAQEDLQRVVVTAPFDGTVTAKRAEVGQRVEIGEPLVEIISRGQIDAVLDVPERIVNQITVGDEVEVRIEALDQRVTGQVIAINPDGTGAARTYPVKVRLDDQNAILKPGMSVVAYMPLERVTPRMTVPRDAVQLGPAGSVVWVAQAQEQGPPVGMSVPVDVLFGHAERFAVEPSGQSADLLQDQSSVVVQGAERIYFPGHPLNVMNGEQAKGPPDSGSRAAPQPPDGDDAPASAERSDAATPTPADG